MLIQTVVQIHRTCLFVLWTHTTDEFELSTYTTCLFVLCSNTTHVFVVWVHASCLYHRLTHYVCFYCVYIQYICLYCGLSHIVYLYCRYIQHVWIVESYNIYFIHMTCLFLLQSDTVNKYGMHFILENMRVCL